MWRMWISYPATGKRSEIMQNADKKYPQRKVSQKTLNFVDNVNNYNPRRLSPTLTISPAPIVINKSPGIHFSKQKFSISSKVGK